MIPRFFLAALLAVSLPALAPAQVPLKPFQPGGAAPQTQTLAGAWKGTFILPRQDNGGKEEVTYLVEVSPDLGTLRVSALPPLSSNPDAYLNPITVEPVAADWDGEVLKAEARQTAQEGKAQLVIIKKFALRAGKDGRHAAFRYDVSVKSSLPHDERTHILSGSGTLTRSR